MSFSFKSYKLLSLLFVFAFLLTTRIAAGETKLKIVERGTPFDISFVVIPASTLILEAAACDPNKVDQYYGNRNGVVTKNEVEKYNLAMDEKAKKLVLKIERALILEQVNDVNISIARLQTRIGSLKQSDNVVLFLVLLGYIGKTSHDTVSTVSIKCLKTSGSLENEQAIGNKELKQNDIFIGVSPQNIKDAKALEITLNTMKSSIDSAVKAALDNIKKLKAAGKKLTEKEETQMIVKSIPKLTLLPKMLSVKKLSGRSFMPIIVEDIPLYNDVWEVLPDEMDGQIMRVDFILDNKGNKLVIGGGGWEWLNPVLSVVGFELPLYDVNLDLGSVKWPYAKIPNNFLTDLRDSSTKDIQLYEGLIKQLNSSKVNLMRRLNELSK